MVKALIAGAPIFDLEQFFPAMTDFRQILIKLTKNLNILLARSAKSAGDTPLSLINQIDDHQQ